MPGYRYLNKRYEGAAFLRVPEGHLLFGLLNAEVGLMAILSRGHFNL